MKVIVREIGNGFTVSSNHLSQVTTYAKDLDEVRKTVEQILNDYIQYKIGKA